MSLTQPITGYELVQLYGYLNSQVLSRNIEDFWAGGESEISSPWNDNWTEAVSGTGATVEFPTDPSDPAGVMRLTTGTATNSACVATSTMGQILLPSGQMNYQMRFRIPTLSDNTDTFLVRFGVGATFTTSGDITNGVYLEYQHNENGGALRLINAIGGVKTIANGSTIIAANTWYFVDIFYEALPSQIVTGYINNNEEFSLTSGFPATNSSMNFCPGQIIKSAGSAVRNFDVDFTFFAVSFASAR